MPLIQVRLLDQVFTDTEKKELISKLTDAMAAVKGEFMRPVTWVLIEDVPSGQWGLGEMQSLPMTRERSQRRMQNRMLLPFLAGCPVRQRR